MLLQLRDVCFVALLADVGRGLQSKLYGPLLGQFDAGGIEEVYQVVNGALRRLISRLQAGLAILGHGHVADDLDDAIESIKRHNGIEQHEQ